MKYKINNAKHNREKSFNMLEDFYAEELQDIEAAIWRAADQGYVSTYVEIPFHDTKIADATKAYLHSLGYGVDYDVIHKPVTKYLALTLYWGYELEK